VSGVALRDEARRGVVELITRCLSHGPGLVACVLLISCTRSEPAPDRDAPPADSARVSALPDSLFGVVASRNDTTCLRTRRREQRALDSVLVIIPDEQRVFRAEVAEELASCRDEAPASDLAYYRLNAAGTDAGYLGIAVLSRTPVPSGARTDIDGDGIAEDYRACTSTEGVHLTVWAGDALRSRRVWHYYYYLGYDVEPNCVEADFIEP
jgi:hypothetical protein